MFKEDIKEEFSSLNNRMITTIVNAVYDNVSELFDRVTIYKDVFSIKNDSFNKNIDFFNKKSLSISDDDIANKIKLLLDCEFQDLLYVYFSFFNTLFSNKFVEVMTSKRESFEGVFVEKRLGYRELIKNNKKVYYYIVNNEKEKTISGFKSKVDYSASSFDRVCDRANVDGLKKLFDENIASMSKSKNNFLLSDLFNLYHIKVDYIKRKKKEEIYLLNNFFLESIYNEIANSHFFRKTKFYKFYYTDVNSDKGYSKIGNNAYSYMDDKKKKIVKLWRSIGCDYNKNNFSRFVSMLYLLNDNEVEALYALMKTYPLLMKVIIDDLIGSIGFPKKTYLMFGVLSGEYAFYDFLWDHYKLKKESIRKLRGLNNHSAGRFVSDIAGSRIKLKTLVSLDKNFLEKKSNIFNFYKKYLLPVGRKMYGIDNRGDDSVMNYIYNQLLENQEKKHTLNYRKYSMFSNRKKIPNIKSDVSVDYESFNEFVTFYNELLMPHIEKIVNKKCRKDKSLNKDNLIILIKNYFYKNLSLYDFFDLAEIFHNRYRLTSVMVNKFIQDRHKNENFGFIFKNGNEININGFKFTEISDAKGLYDEGEFMDHCVAGYATVVEKNISSIFKVEPLYHSPLINNRTTLNIKFQKNNNEIEPTLLQNSSYKNIRPTQENKDAINAFFNYMKENKHLLNSEKIVYQSNNEGINYYNNDFINILKNNFEWEYEYFLSLIPKYKRKISLEENVEVAFNKIINNKSLIYLAKN